MQESGMISDIKPITCDLLCNNRV